MTSPDITPLLEPTRFSELNREEEVSLLDLLRVLRLRWRAIGLSITLTMALASAIVMLIPVSYTAEAVIMPPQQDQTSQAMLMGPLAGLGGLAGLTGMGGAGPVSKSR